MGKGFDRFKKGFDAWEAKTATVLEHVMKSPLVLAPAGALLSASMKVRAARQKKLAELWGGIGLPTKRDQERTLHALHQLESKLLDLEEKIADLEGPKKK